MPHGVSAVQTFTVRVPSPRNAPSWCHSVGASGSARRSDVFFADSAGGSPKYSPMTRVTPERRSSSTTMNSACGASTASTAPKRKN